MEIKGFITNLGKYNEGELIGEWITFPIDEDELEAVFERIGIGSPYYEEYFFTDWECEAELHLNEHERIERVNEIAEIIGNFDGLGENVFKAACELYNLEDALRVGDFLLVEGAETDEDIGYYWAEESDAYDLDSLGDFRNYIDYEKFGRDIRLATDGGFTSYGWIERFMRK